MKKKSLKLTIVMFIGLFLCLSLSRGAWAAASKVSREEVRQAAQKTIQYYHDNFQKNQFAGVLDWPALGLFGFGEDVSGPQWSANGKNGAYWREREVSQGVNFSKTKNTDLQRTIIGVCAAGKDPRNFGGLNLVELEKGTMLPSGHFADSVADNKTGQPVGNELINAQIFGIIALHCAGEPIPNRDKCLEWLEKQQHTDGGFTWDVKYFDDPRDYELVESDVDMTAAALMGFAILGEDESNPVVARALDFLRTRQLDSGGFYSWGTENPESCAWTTQALVLLGQDPMGPEWTNSSGENPVSAILNFQLPDGSFSHVLKEEDNLPIYDSGISTYEALYALADAYNKKSVYQLLHEKYQATQESTTATEAKGKFSDFQPGQFGYEETLELVNDNVLSGYADGSFKPGAAVTRAEFARYLTYGLGLQNESGDQRGSDRFSDVPSEHWANGCIGICAARGYVSGIREGVYAPDEKITGEQLMSMLVRAGGLEAQAQTLREEGKGWADGYIKAAEQKGLTYPGFEPQSPASRAQCAWSVCKLRNLKK